MTRNPAIKEIECVKDKSGLPKERIVWIKCKAGKRHSSGQVQPVSITRLMFSKSGKKYWRRWTRLM